MQKSKTPPSLLRWLRSTPKIVSHNLSQKMISGNNVELGLIPYDVKIKLTFRCNAECYYCLHGIKTHVAPKGLHNQELSKFEWKKILKELQKIGTKVITFSGGEPTIRPDLTELVKYAGKTLGMRVKMTSNGSLITPSLAEDLAKGKLKTINISLDGIGRHHDLVRGKDFFNRTWTAIENLSEMKKKYGRPQIRINHVITSKNYKYLADFISYIDNSNVDISALHFLFVDFDHNSSEFALSKEAVTSILDQYNHLKDIIKLDIRESNLLLDLDHIQNDFTLGKYAVEALQIPCYFPYIHMFILPNGNCIVCCGAERNNKLVLGNVRQQSVQEVWEGKGYQKLRKYLIKNKYNFCGACDHGIEINKTISNVVRSIGKNIY